MDMPKRKQNRLEGYDYSSNGAYFVTMCTKDMRCTLARISTTTPQATALELSSFGRIAEKYIQLLPEKYPRACVDKYVIMPNHIHMIILLASGPEDPAPTKLDSIIGWYKYQITKTIDNLQSLGKEPAFQRSYHDHIIRNDADYRRIWIYIDENPLKWALDRYYRLDEV